MYKALGGIVILFASFLISCLKVTESKERFENLNEMYKALTILKSEISFSNTELLRAVIELSERLSGKVGLFFKVISDRLKHDETLEFKDAWEMESENGEAKICISLASQKILTDFVAEFGKRDKEIELQNLDKTLEALEREIREDSVRYKTNRKLIYSLGLMGGISVMIFFI